MREFMPHQVPAWQYAEKRNRIALFMEMRLGKTLVAIRWAQRRMSGEYFFTDVNSRTLVVAPVSTIKQWENELLQERVSPYDICWLSGKSSTEKFKLATRDEPKWFLVNYDGLRACPALAQLPWDVIILDESTKIKNPSAKITKLLLQKFDRVKYRAILTGMPSPESSMDFYCQMLFLDGDQFMGHANFWSWRNRFFFPSGYDWILKKIAPGFPAGTSTREAIRAAVAKEAFVMTRKEAKVGSMLVHEQRVIPINANQWRALRDIKKKWKYGDLETKFAGTRHVWMQRIAGGFSPDRENPVLIANGKTEEILQLIAGELAGQQLVIWFHFNEELAHVYHTLKAKHISVTAALGATPPEKRYARQAKFQAGKVQVFCIQEEVGKFGLDLSAADTEIYYSNAWSYETRAQSQDRIIHLRKTYPLLAIDLVTGDTTDEDVTDTLLDKSINAKSFQSKLLSKIRSRFDAEEDDEEV